ncbi:MAG: carbohydrate ABC transporter permease [Chloroflexi bacterium]|nr:carbohydrate ABC transporter permease [Chloroflexota bacterium]
MKHIWNFLKYAVVIGLALIMSGPVITALLGSIRTSGEFISQPIGLPKNGVQWQNYTSILTSASFWSQLRSSLIISLGAVLVTITVSCLLGFVFARVEFRGRPFWFNLLMIGLLFPLTVAILPGAHRSSHPDPCVQLERIPSAFDHPQRSGEMAAAARSHAISGAIWHRLGAGDGLCHAAHHSGGHLLYLRRKVHRYRADWWRT